MELLKPGKAEIYPRRVVRKVAIISAVLALGLLGAISTLVAVRFGLFQTDEGKALAGLLIMMSVALLLVSSFGFILAIWGAFVSTYLQLQGWKVEAAEATEHVQVIVHSVEVGAPIEVSTRYEALAEVAVAETVPLHASLVLAMTRISEKAPTEAAELVLALLRKSRRVKTNFSSWPNLMRAADFIRRSDSDLDRILTGSSSGGQLTESVHTPLSRVAS